MAMQKTMRPLLVLTLGVTMTAHSQAPVESAAAEPLAANATAAPVNPYAGDLFTRLRLLGDPFGLRSRAAEQGFTFDVFATQFYQGLASGGQERTFQYAGKLDYLANLDGQKAGLWQGFFVNLHAETRYGTTVNGVDGLLAPSNIAASFPAPDGTVSAITGLKLTQALSESFALYAGKINTLDEYPLRYSPGLGTNKPGLEGFMNTSLVFNPILGRTTPYSTAGVGAAIINDGKPVFTLSAFDPEDRTTDDFEDLYARGVVIVPDLVIRHKLLGKPGLVNFGGSYSTAKYRSFDPAAYLMLLSDALNAIRQQRALPVNFEPLETGSWSLYSNFYQSLWVDPCDDNRTWGIFGQFGISDGNPNPIRYVANGGIGGRSPIAGRTLDTFGVGFFYLGLSDQFKSLTRPLLPQQDEYGAELFYNYAITPWARFTADIQFARPSTIALDTAIIPGIRLQILF
jgi:porin